MSVSKVPGDIKKFSAYKALEGERRLTSICRNFGCCFENFGNWLSNLAVINIGKPENAAPSNGERCWKSLPKSYQKFDLLPTIILWV